jgi:hypothetical protein
MEEWFKCSWDCHNIIIASNFHYRDILMSTLKYDTEVIKVVKACESSTLQNCQVISRISAASQVNKRHIFIHYMDKILTTQFSLFFLVSQLTSDDQSALFIKETRRGVNWSFWSSPEQPKMIISTQGSQQTFWVFKV